MNLKTLRRGLVLGGTAAALALLVSSGYPTLGADAPEPVPEFVNNPAVVAEGRAVFAQNCGTFECHNNYGGGGFMEDARKVNDEKWYRSGGSFGEILATVANGVPGTPMNSWANKLDSERIKAVAAYVYLLSRGRAPQ